MIKMMRFQRRQRTTFSKQQLEALQEAFKKSHYPEAHRRLELAKITNLDPSRIQVWFQNQRAKDKKRHGQGHYSDEPEELDQQIFRRQIATGMEQQQQQQQSQPHHHQRQPLPQQQQQLICVFNSAVANEAAAAVSEGKFASLIHYHRCKFQSNHQEVLTYGMASTCSSKSPNSSSLSDSPIDNQAQHRQEEPRASVSQLEAQLSGLNCDRQPFAGERQVSSLSSGLLDTSKSRYDCLQWIHNI